MAFGTTLQYSRMRLLIEDPAVPGTYVKVCGLNSRGLSTQKNLNEIVTPDCDDDDAPAVTEYDVASSGWSISGEGVLTEQGFPIMEKFRAAGVPWNIKYELSFPGAVGLVTYSGVAFLQSLELNASRGTRGTITFSIQGSGALTKS
jgi:hypothetical protein